MQRKFGKYAIPHLTAVLIGLYVVGYILQLINPNAVSYMTLEPALILRGQVWRLITWLIIPPSSLGIFTIIMLFFYLSIGRSLERAWGDFRYNVYIFGGIIITIIAAFISYAVFSALAGQGVLFSYGPITPFSTYYICMSIFLAFAATFPDAQIMLYFVIPLRVKWLGLLYAAFLIYDAVQYVRAVLNGVPTALVYIIAMLASFVNFLIFFFATKDLNRFSPKEQKRRRDFQRKMEEARRAAPADAGMQHPGEAKQPRHRCTVCGRTELSDPDLDFRICSKCDGIHEYCNDHLFTHEHIHEEN